MRIIAGQYRRRQLKTPPGLTTRPMPDRVRESVFGMLGTRVQGAAVLDLFAGCGCIGIEAISRGAKSCIFVDLDKGAGAVIRDNLDALGIGPQATVVQGDALGASILARSPRPTDLIFVDPPYPMIREPGGWERMRRHCGQLAELLAEDGFLVLRTPWPFVLEVPIEEAAGGLGVAGPGAGDRLGAPVPRRKGRKQKRERFRWGQGPEGEAVEWLSRIDGPVGGRAGGGTSRGGAGAMDEEPLPGADAGGEGDEEDGVVVRGVPELTVERVKPDLSLPGARGPETHAYGSTAVHWYMRGAGGSDGAKG
jgi:16S rRNA (guanine(966)-N(2))-methyltransferase RsmD